MTVLHQAASTELLNLLVNAGADVNIQNISNHTALHIAAGRGRTEVAKLLVDAGADVNMQDGERATALHFAARQGHTEVVKLLVNAGADVNMQDGERATALHFAARQGHTEVVKLLVNAGADVNIQDENGVMALYVAAEKGDTEVLKLLVDAGADVNMQDGGGLTVLHCTAFGNLLTAQYLITEVRNTCTCNNDNNCCLECIHIEGGRGHTLQQSYRVSPCYLGYEHDCNVRHVPCMDWLRHWKVSLHYPVLALSVHTRIKYLLQTDETTL